MRICYLLVCKHILIIRLLCIQHNTLRFPLAEVNQNAKQNVGIWVKLNILENISNWAFEIESESA